MVLCRRSIKDKTTTLGFFDLALYPEGHGKQGGVSHGDWAPIPLVEVTEQTRRIAYDNEKKGCVRERHELRYQCENWHFYETKLELDKGRPADENSQLSHEQPTI